MKSRFLLHKNLAITCLLVFSYSAYSSDHLVFEIEQFRKHAHKQMDDGDVNAIYHVELDKVADFLPIIQKIQRKIVKSIHRDRVVTRAALKIFRNSFVKCNPSKQEQIDPREFFQDFKEEVPYTYVILDDQIIFTESTHDDVKEKYKCRYSKHYFIAGLPGKVRYAGEFFIYIDRIKGAVFVVFDNASGTYRPLKSELAGLKDLLNHNFSSPQGGLYFITKTYQQKIDKVKLLGHHSRPFVEDAN